MALSIKELELKNKIIEKQNLENIKEKEEKKKEL